VASGYWTGSAPPGRPPATAGHCVGPQGGRSYYSNFLFCPQYNNGDNRKVGCWSWALAQQAGGWYYNGYWSADYAYLYM
jgi:hypothetical protein